MAGRNCHRGPRTFVFAEGERGAFTARLAGKAFEYLKEAVRRHFHEAMLEGERYLIKKFYNDDYNLARQKKLQR